MRCCTFLQLGRCRSDEAFDLEITKSRKSTPGAGNFTQISGQFLRLKIVTITQIIEWHFLNKKNTWTTFQGLWLAVRSHFPGRVWKMQWMDLRSVHIFLILRSPPSSRPDVSHDSYYFLVVVFFFFFLNVFKERGNRNSNNFLFHNLNFFQCQVLL